jgi:hypothetical protein
MPEAQFLGQIATPDNENMRSKPCPVNVEATREKIRRNGPAIVYHMEARNCADSRFTTDKAVIYRRKKCRKLKQLRVILWLIKT